ncbi:MAG: 3-dehydroquinate synthase [Bacillota bacterium]
MRPYDLQVKTAGFSYRVLIEEGGLSGVGKSLRLLFSATRTLLISDRTVFDLYGEKIINSLETENWQVNVFLLEPGESSKTLDQASRIYDAAVDAGLDRNSPIVALGGGVPGDLAGFAAATYLRGVPLVMLPTTLLAQVDSSVGGKTAVNHPRGKNLIGTIYPPRVVVIDPLVIKSLPGDQFRAGLAEVLKYGIIVDSAFFYWLERNIKELKKAESNSLAEAIAYSVKAKARVVEDDEYENNYRRVLNFGHTIGHALEAATSYSYYLHGEAVLIGMIAAVDLAERLRVLNDHAAERIGDLLKHIEEKKPPADLTTEMVIDKLRQDKKHREDELIFVLPRAIGKAAIIPVTEKLLIGEVIEAYLKKDTGKN